MFHQPSESLIVRFASLFTGGDLAGEGARAAGLIPIWGIESSVDIAAIAELNGTPIIVGKVEDVDFSQLESPDWLHFSPPCINASVANQDAGEAPEDVAMARGCINAIRQLKSPFVSLENVWQYRKFESFQLIHAALMEPGYQIRFWHLCAADYGVAQTRKRLILVASLKGTPKRPEQTHTPEGHVGMFETIPRWIGWYEAIEDLIPSLPESQFAEWQLIRLQENIGTQMIGGGNTNKEIIDSQSRGADDPMFTVSTHSPGNNRAFLLSKAEISNTVRDINPRFESEPIRKADKPAVSVGCHSPGHHKAFLMPGGNSSSAEPREPREPREPSQTIGDTERVGNIPRAFLVDRINYNSATVRDGSEPAFTESVYDSQHQAPQAFLINEQESSSKSGLQIKCAEDPSPTATATATQHPMRALLSQGKVLALTVRALARLQSIPDSYILPEKNSLACRIVGNAVPPLLMQRIIEAQLK